MLDQCLRSVLDDLEHNDLSKIKITLNNNSVILIKFDDIYIFVLWMVLYLYNLIHYHFLMINEYYYFFSLKKEMNFDESVNLKLKLIKKFNIEFKDDENLYRILSLKDGKIMVDTEFLSYVNEEVDFKFDVASQQTKNIFIQQGE